MGDKSNTSRACGSLTCLLKQDEIRSRVSKKIFSNMFPNISTLDEKSHFAWLCYHSAKNEI